MAKRVFSIKVVLLGEGGVGKTSLRKVYLGEGFKQSYQGRKLLLVGHTRPLVFSGESEALTRIRNVRSTSGGSQVVMRANKLNLKNPHSEIDMREEATRISNREVPQLVDSGERVLDRGINAFEGRIVVTNI